MERSRTIIGRWNNTDIDPITSLPYGWQNIYTNIAGALNLFTYDNSLGISVDLTGAPLSLITGYIQAQCDYTHLLTVWLTYLQK